LLGKKGYVVVVVVRKLIQVYMFLDFTKSVHLRTRFAQPSQSV